MTYPIPPSDPRIHVFSVSDGTLKLDHQTYLSRLSAPGDGPSLSDALGAEVDATYAEVFAMADIAPMSLRDYLAEAHDILPDVLTADAARLDALSGDVVVLAPAAVDGLATLAPRPEITPIGAYAPIEADDTRRALPSAAPQPGIATPATSTGARSANRRILWMVLGALVLAALTLLIL
ncbi:MAG: hypothetical protein AAF264_05295 [Pseudomonadota bacterium]